MMATNGMSPRMFPITPPTIISGRKAATVVMADAATGQNMRRAPAMAASAGAMPERKRDSAYSPITIASSSITPRVSSRPNRLIMLIVPPKAHSSASAAR